MSARGDILVVHRGPLASFVSALPAMKAIRAAHRGQRIAMLSAPPVDALAADTPYVDEVLDWESAADLDDLAKVAQRVKSEKFARIYDLERAEPSEKLFAATKPFPPPWCGAARGMKFRHDLDPKEHRLTALARQLAMAGIKVDPEEKPDARWAKTARSNAPSLKPEFFGLERPYVLLAPASPAKGEAPPRWPIARFAGLAARLAANGVGVGVVTDPGDRGPGRAVAQAAPDARDLSRADLTQVASLAVESAGCLGHADSGVVHLMAAAGAPSVVIARTMDEGLRIGPVGNAVITLAAPDPTQTTVEYAAQLISMYMHVGKLDRRAKDERGDEHGDEHGEEGAEPGPVSTEDEEAS